MAGMGQKWKRSLEAVLDNPAPKLPPLHVTRIPPKEDGESQVLATQSQYHQCLRELPTPQGTNSMWSWVKEEKVPLGL